MVLLRDSPTYREGVVSNRGPRKDGLDKRTERPWKVILAHGHNDPGDDLRAKTREEFLTRKPYTFEKNPKEEVLEET